MDDGLRERPASITPRRDEPLVSIWVTVTDTSDEEITPTRHISILMLALRDRLAQLPDDERERVIDSLVDLVRSVGPGQAASATA
jgi:hypothetical protein